MGVFIATTRAIFRLCMGLLSARCSSSGGSTCVETTSDSHVHFAKHSPGEMMRPSIAENIPMTGNQTAAMNCYTYIAHSQWDESRYHASEDCDCPHRLGCYVSFECCSHQAHGCMFPHFRPPVVLSTVS